jgi:HEAT repeat protein
MSFTKPLLSAILTLLLAPALCLAHYPFPCSQEEHEAAELIGKAVEARTQESVATLVDLLEDENSRIQTAALLGTIHLADRPLDFTEVETVASELKDSERDFLSATGDVAVIVFDKELTDEERLARLVLLTKSTEGRENGMLPRGEGQKAYQRRMAAETLGVLGDASVLSDLEALVDDGFPSWDDSFDMKPCGRVAFESWWKIREPELSEEEKLPALVGSLHLGTPFRSRWCDAACNLLYEAGEASVPYLIPLANGDDRNAMLWALRTLSSLSDCEDARRAALETCLREIFSEDALVRQASAGTLSRTADESALPALANVLETSPHADVRERTVFALQRIEGDQAVALLKAALADDEPYVRTRAAAVLVRKGVHEGETILLEALENMEYPYINIAIDSIPHIQNQTQLVERLGVLLQEQPGERDLEERPRLLLEEKRNSVLRTLEFYWEEEEDRIRPIVERLKPCLEEMEPKTGDVQSLLNMLEE